MHEAQCLTSAEDYRRLKSYGKSLSPDVLGI